MSNYFDFPSFTPTYVYNHMHKSAMNLAQHSQPKPSANKPMSTQKPAKTGRLSAEFLEQVAQAPYTYQNANPAQVTPENSPFR